MQISLQLATMQLQILEIFSKMLKIRMVIIFNENLKFNSWFSEIRLFSGKDPLKDQTFFLCTVNQEQLKRAMFPLGSLQKSEVKRIAEEQGFQEVAKKPEVRVFQAVLFLLITKIFRAWEFVLLERKNDFRIF